MLHHLSLSSCSTLHTHTNTQTHKHTRSTVNLACWKFPQIEGVMKYDVLMQLCRNRNHWWSFGLLFGYKLVFMIIVLVLAFLTRNIKNQSFTYKNTSHSCLSVLGWYFVGIFILFSVPWENATVSCIFHLHNGITKHHAVSVYGTGLHTSLVTKT